MKNNPIIHTYNPIVLIYPCCMSTVIITLIIHRMFTH